MEYRLKLLLRDRDKAREEYARIQEDLQEVRQILQDTKDECEELRLLFKWVAPYPTLRVVYPAE